VVFETYIFSKNREITLRQRGLSYPGTSFKKRPAALVVCPGKADKAEQGTPTLPGKPGKGTDWDKEQNTHYPG